MKRVVIIGLMVLQAAGLSAQEPLPKLQSTLKKGLDKVETYIDSSTVKHMDLVYVERPERPWAVELRTDANETTVKMHTDFDFLDGTHAGVSSSSSNGFSMSLGAWVGYRGYGFGWSKELTGGDGTTFSLSASGRSYGANFRIRSYHSNMPEFLSATADPIKVRSLFLDGYYLFNSKRFSYAAAYDQSLIQRLSAGTPMVGAMYHHSSVNYSADPNWDWVYFMRGISKVKFTQASVGAGYAYNWVPAHGWLFSILAMPMITLYNRTSLYYDDSTTAAPEDEYVTPNKVTWNFNARLAVVYNWQRFYLRVYGHFNRFNFGTDDVWGHLYDWKVYAALGFRF